MNLLLLNPPHPSIGSRIPVEHLPPLGLLAIGGPLLDDGHDVQLLNADLGPMSVSEVVAEIGRRAPQAVLVGHSGSTSGHPSAMALTRAIRSACPSVWILYGGVFPTYHWKEILESEPQIDVVVRGEGEETTRRLIQALETGGPVDVVRGIAFRQGLESGRVWRAGGDPSPNTRLCATPPAEVIHDLDAYRVGWELIDHRRYTYWGHRRAVVVQFSRGCPHHCTYCGQHAFWTRWRHRDPVRFAAELARLHREHGVEVINFADEDPTASRPAWKAFLEALVAERVSLILVGSTRAGDIVRDVDLLPLYKQAGVARLLMGFESTDERTLDRIRKGSCTATDREAVRLLRQHGILSMAAFVSGFEDAEDRDYWRTLRQLVAYDPDQIQSLFVTPHRWTPLFRELADRRVLQPDLGRWDYKHQVLASPRMPPWRMLLWTKFTEAVMQLRPRSLWRYLAHPDPGLRDALRWYYRIGRRVWPHEVWQFLFRDRRIRHGPTLAGFLGAPQDTAAEAHSIADCGFQNPGRPEILSPVPACDFRAGGTCLKSDGCVR